jgi:hypothetical protein
MAMTRRVAHETPSLPPLYPGTTVQQQRARVVDHLAATLRGAAALRDR